MMRNLTIFAKEPILVPMLVLLIVVWLIPHTAIPANVKERLSEKYQQLPKVKVDFHPSLTFRNRFSTNKTALYIETSNDVKHVTPLLLHMTQVVPPEWRFLFIGSQHQIETVNRSTPARLMMESGKLRIEAIDKYTEQWTHKDISQNEIRNRLLTNTTFYTETLPGVEHLLTFQSHSILCANANVTVNDYLNYTWVGAPWKLDDHFGGAGGLSLRRVSAVREVLEFQQRLDDTEDEDKWLSKRVGLLPNSTNADPEIESRFSVESIWQEKPLGYVVPLGDLRPGTGNEVWNTLERRREIYQHCPEIKMILRMQLERLRCETPPTNAFFEGVKEQEQKEQEENEGKSEPENQEPEVQSLSEADDQSAGTRYDKSHSSSASKSDPSAPDDEKDIGDNSSSADSEVKHSPSDIKVGAGKLATPHAATSDSDSTAEPDATEGEGAPPGYKPELGLGHDDLEPQEEVEDRLEESDENPEQDLDVDENNAASSAASETDIEEAPTMQEEFDEMMAEKIRGELSGEA